MSHILLAKASAIGYLGMKNPLKVSHVLLAKVQAIGYLVCYSLNSISVANHHKFGVFLYFELIFTWDTAAFKCFVSSESWVMS